MKLHVVGHPRKMLFGMRSDEHLSRQLEQVTQDLISQEFKRSGEVLPEPNLTLVAAADVTASSVTVGWLVDHPGRYLTGRDGRALMVVVPDAEVADAIEAINAKPGPDLVTRENGSIDVFVRKLRRREPVEVLDLVRTSRKQVERRLFDLVYKGITDVVTRYVWPTPAFHVVRVLAAYRIPPNAVTLVGIALVFVAMQRFFHADWVGGLAAGWVMTFLDTVDGKLARTTGTSSRLGNSLDHVTDVVHPPLWWICVAIGASAGLDATSRNGMMLSCAVIVATYAVGRFCESSFKRRFGFNQFLWRPFDSHLRLVVARRNVNLIILTVGVLLGSIATAFHVLALWSVVSLGAQAVRYRHAIRVSARGETISNWMAELPSAG